MKITHVSKPASCQGAGGVRHDLLTMYLRELQQGPAASERASRAALTAMEESLKGRTRVSLLNHLVCFFHICHQIVRFLFYFPAGRASRRNDVAPNYT